MLKASRYWRLETVVHGHWQKSELLFLSLLILPRLQAYWLVPPKAKAYWLVPCLLSFLAYLSIIHRHITEFTNLLGGS